MTEKKSEHRRPAAFALDDAPKASPSRPPQTFEGTLDIVHETEDPFAEPDKATSLPDVPPPPKRFPLFKIAGTALGVVLSFAFGLWADQLIRNLFSRSDWLGYTAAVALGVLVVAVIGIVAREVWGLASLRNVEQLRTRLADISPTTGEKEAKAAVKALCDHLASTPQTAGGRAVIDDSMDDLMDSAGLVRLAEMELMKPLDREARRLISNAARRVSVVTAISPRALTDIGYVLFEAARLVRALSALYGGRPGFFGLIRLLRAVVAHLAVTGTIALGDSLVQQVLGHGLASKISARLGEGVANGLMTARVGVAAMELARPMEFVAEKRPKVTDFLTAIRISEKSS
ncbi:YcjF family protein [Rhizobium sp. L1K21]|uniref:YcjF family protein n=1 Tax=Rhizobium sp. L1K21 TaxID=2954933 RepID=UPI0020928ECD|nr:TIGR01620 family protein [Rhizobium sp. L1K21]MCO6186205.1 TIGR01620 family protein [Rhizobium sp. L1K21]